MEALLYIVLSQSLFAALMIWSLKKKHFANSILIAWLISLALAMVINIVKHAHPELQYSAFGVSIILTHGPFLLLYVDALIKKQPKFNPRMFIHFIPCIIFLIYFSFYRFEPVFENRDWMVQDQYFLVRTLFSITCLFSLIGYCTITSIKIKRHQIRLKNEYSDISDFVTLGWLKLLSLIFFSGYGILIVVAAFFKVDQEIPSYIFIGTQLIFSYLVTFLGFKQPIIFDPNREVIITRHIKDCIKDNSEYLGFKEPETPQVKYEKSGLKLEKAEHYLDKLLSYMKEQKPYLQGDLTLQDLADNLSISKHHLTQVINEKLNKNFYLFINEYRVEVVKQMMADASNNNLTILAIAFDCGFNSKSSFNKIFKQITGMTPTQYKSSIS